MKAPGISVAAVIEMMKSATLSRLLGNELVGTITQLSGSIPTPEELRQVAKTLYADNNPAAIQSAQVRSHLIDALPSKKLRNSARNLASHQKVISIPA